MFNNLVESTGVRRSARTARIFAGTVVLWSLALIAAIVVGIVAFDAKVSADFEKSAMMSAVAPAPQPPPPPAAKQSSAAVKGGQAAPLQSVIKAPDVISRGKTVPPVLTSQVGATIGLPPGNIRGEVGLPNDFGPSDESILDTGSSALPKLPPPPAPEVAVDTSKPRVSGTPLSGKAIKKVQPPYPEMAKQIGARGAVVVEVTVNEDGSVIGARAVTGHPTLRAAAVSAAREWKFSSTTIRGVPVKVVGTITFNFVIGS